MIIRILILSIFCFFSHAVYSAAPQDDPRINEILTYWFGDLQSDQDYPQDRNKIWFGGGSEVDKEIRERFESLVLDAASHQLDEWKETPKGRLALIILVDQFTRNIYRGTSDSFALDYIARELALEGIEIGVDKELFPIERVFFYLPLEHAEDLKIQELSIVKFNELTAVVDSSLASIFEGFAGYALRHYEIVERFGRFPHRNSIVERESTQEELEFLKGPGSSF